jgi:hypothetical protein
MTLSSFGRGIAYIAVSVASIVYLSGHASASLRDSWTLRGTGHFLSSSYASTDAATVTLTNLASVRAFGCWRGMVQSKGGATAATAIVCTGAVEPRSTLQQSAPFAPGEVVRACSTGPAGAAVFSWDNCTFTVEDKTSLAM